MAQTSIKAAQFSGVVGNGESGYVLQSSGNGDMSWVASITPPAVTSLSYPGSATAADPAGGQTVTLTGTGFASGATVTVGGTAAPAVSFVSATTLTITTPVKAAGDYDVVVTNTDTGSATFINGISYNGIPAWTTAAGSLGTFASAETISTITLQATEPDAGTITFNITNGALPTGLSLTGANIDGTTSLETAETLYTFTVTATDDESQTTPRVFTITVQKQFIGTENFTINTYTGNGSTLAVEGKIGTAADFNGSSSEIVASSSITPSSGGFAISWWQKTTQADNTYSYTIDNGGGSLGNGLYVLTHRTDVGLIIGFKNSSTFGSASIPYSSAERTQWTHFCFSWDGTTTTNAFKIYKNNIATSFTSTVTNAGAAYPFRIGRSYNGTDYFGGSIDQVRIFDKELSSTEVTTLYGESNTSTTKSTTDIFDDGSGLALYEFEEGAKDTGGVTGYIGAGSIFNGSGSAINLGATNQFASSGVSVSMWINPSSVTTNQVLIGNGNGGSFAEGDLFIAIRTDGYIGYEIGQSASIYEARYATTTQLTTNTWQHILMTFDSSLGTTIGKIYVNGTLQSTSATYAAGGTFSGDVFIGTLDLQLGKRNVSGQELWYNGKLDQVRIFNKAISSSEVTTLYNETSASTTKSITDIFDDGSGVALYELEGNANDTGLYGRGAIDTGQSAVFNGSSSEIVVPTVSNIKSYSFWIKAVAVGSNYGKRIFGLDSSSYTNSVIYIGNTSSKVGVADGVGNIFYSDIVSDNNWHHIAITTDGNTLKIYTDGVVSSTNSTIYFTSSFTHIGTNNTNRQFNGKIDQVRIYDTELSQSDVEALVSETNVPTANLVAHYKLDGNANDETGNYNGTATSITYSDPAEFPTYDGTATNVSYAYDGTPTNVSFVGTSFQPDLVWIKNRDNIASQFIHDSVRGIDNDHYLTLITNETFGESTFNQSWHNSYGRLSNISSNGFTINQGSVTSETSYNKSGDDYVAWCWKAGGAATSNTDGTITSTVSANQDAGFSIVGLTIPNANTQSVGHGLNSAPEMIIMKARNSAESWLTYHSSVGLNKYLLLNSNAAEASYSGIWPNVNSSTFTTIYHVASGSPTRDVIAYCFHSVDGYQKIDSYTGTGAAGNTVTTGFEPRFLMIKRSNNSGNWFIYDNQRGSARYLNPDLSNIEGTDGGIVFNSNGFTINVTYSDHNTSGGEYIYLAIA